MSTLKIAVPGSVFQTSTNVTAGLTAQWTTTQIPIALGAGGALSNTNNIATITFNAAHGLTFTPAAGVMANYFIQFNTVSAQTGVGTLNGPIFRILSIPSTTTITIYTTVLTATMTAANAVPVFIPVLGAIVGSTFASPTVTMTTTLTQGPLVASAFVNCFNGANCTVQWDMGNISIIEDSTTGSTLATAPTFRNLLLVSTSGQLWIDGTGAMAIFASGGAGSSYYSIIE